MKTALSVALLLLVMTATLGLVIIIRDGHQALTHGDQLLQQTIASERALDQTITKITAAADTLNGAATEERSNWAKTSDEAAKTGRAVRTLIDRVDRKLVDETLAHVNAVTLPAIDSEIQANGDQLKLTIAKLGNSADGVTAVAGALNLRLSDPEIPKLLGHLDVMGDNLETITENGAAMSGDMKLAVHRLAQPPSKLHTVLDFGYTTAKFGSLFIP